jgi:hypothetical protein
MKTRSWRPASSSLRGDRVRHGRQGTDDELSSSPADRDAWARVGTITGSNLAVSGKAAWFGTSTALARPVVLVWDDLNAHVSGIAEMVAARDWLTVYRLPPYAHELNPVEPVWSVLKDLWPTWSNTTSAS